MCYTFALLIVILLYASDKELTKTVPKVKAVCLADLN